jgi:hypothetical protein
LMAVGGQTGASSAGSVAAGAAASVRVVGVASVGGAVGRAVQRRRVALRPKAAGRV